MLPRLVDPTFISFELLNWFLYEFPLFWLSCYLAKSSHPIIDCKRFTVSHLWKWIGRDTQWLSMYWFLILNFLIFLIIIIWNCFLIYQIQNNVIQFAIFSCGVARIPVILTILLKSISIKYTIKKGLLSNRWKRNDVLLNQLSIQNWIHISQKLCVRSSWSCGKSGLSCYRLLLSTH